MSEKVNYLYHAINVNKEICIACSHCVKVCPTEAMNIWEGKSHIDPEKCIDCDECYRACPVDAIEVEDDGIAQIYRFKHRAALIPSVFMGQFQNRSKSKEIFEAIQELGFQYVYEVEESSHIIEELSSQQIKSNSEKPLISSFCPSVLRLIQVSFPDFTDNIINLKTPVDITAASVRKRLNHLDNVGIFYFTPCSSKITSLKAPIGEKKSVLDGVINISSIYNKVNHILNNNHGRELRSEKFISNNAIQADHILWSLSGGESKNLPGVCLSIDGTKNIISFLDRMSTKGINGIDFLEMKNCDQGCAGGILNPQDRFLTAQKLRNRSKYYAEYYALHPNELPKKHGLDVDDKDIFTSKIEPRAIIAFDENPLVAVEKMKSYHKILKQLPHIDCSVCGYQTCKSFAKNVVKGKSKIEHCFVVQRKLESTNNLDASDSKKLLEDIWGQKILKA